MLAVVLLALPESGNSVLMLIVLSWLVPGLRRHRATAGIYRKLKSTQKLLSGLLSVAACGLHGIRPGHAERCPGQGDAQDQCQATG